MAKGCQLKELLKKQFPDDKMIDSVFDDPPGPKPKDGNVFAIVPVRKVSDEYHVYNIDDLNNVAKRN